MWWRTGAPAAVTALGAKTCQLPPWPNPVTLTERSRLMAQMSEAREAAKATKAYRCPPPPASITPPAMADPSMEEATLMQPVSRLVGAHA